MPTWAVTKPEQLAIFSLLLVPIPANCGFAQSPLLRDFSPPKTISIGEISVLQVPPGASAESIQGLLNKAINQSGEDRTVRLQFASGAEYRVAAATARVAIGMLEQEQAAQCGDVCSPNPQ